MVSSVSAVEIPPHTLIVQTPWSDVTEHARSAVAAAPYSPPSVCS